MNKNKEMKNGDVTFVQYRSEIIKAKDEEEAGAIAEEHRLPNERVGVIEETDEEVIKNGYNNGRTV